MNHSEAVRLKAAEKYLLGELSAELRDQYEDHYFGCAECAQDVAAGAVLVDNARDVWRTEPLAGTAAGTSAGKSAEAAARPGLGYTGGWWSGLLRPAFVAPALLLLLLVAGYQNAVTIPHLKTLATQSETAQTLPSFSLIAQNSRGAAPLTIRVPAGKPFSLFIDIPPQTEFASFVCEFQSESGTPELSLNVSAQEAKQTVQLLVPAGRLVSGKHVLVVRGIGSPGKADADKIGAVSYPFSLEYTR